MQPDSLALFTNKSRARVVPHGPRYSFLCDVTVTYGLDTHGLTLVADELATRAGHEFPFDFTPLLQVEGGQGYVLWVEGLQPAQFCWRVEGSGRKAGESFDQLPENPVEAVAHLATMLSTQQSHP